MRRNSLIRNGALVALGISAAIAAGYTQARDVTDADIANDATSVADVVTAGLGQQAQRYSPLAQVNARTVKDLVPVWSLSFGGEKQRGQEEQPLVFDGVMYVHASYNRMFAIDVKSGKELWKYEHRLPEGIMPCCDVINRGAALYGNLVIMTTLDSQIVALNKDTGKVVWKEKIDEFTHGYSNSAAPLIVNGKVITGVSGSEFGVRGRVEARDARTGRMLWSRPTVEGNMGYRYDDKGNRIDNGISGTTNATWPGDLWKYGGAAPWNNVTYDPETNLIFVGTGNPGPWNSHMRPGDNLFSCSTLAIDPDTGKIKWHYQGTPHDGWDYDGVNELVSFDLKKDGKVIKAGGKADRNGFFYVLDRTDGKLLNAFPFVRDISWAKGIDLKTGRPIYNDDRRPGNPSDSADGKKGKAVFVTPSFLGGKNQMPMAYSPQSGMFYVPANEWGMEIWNEPVVYKRGAAYLGAGFTIKPLHDDYIGAMRAIDPVNGKIVWEDKNGAPLWGGVLATGGGLVFYGTPEGFLKAVDAKTGQELWKFQTGSGIVAPPITYEQDGEQYVTVVSGWGGAVPLWGGEVAKRVSHLEQGGAVWTFKLHR